ncbi:bh protein [Neobacillus sp. MM2021_6]|uniref:bh protein n=1 Tax=Bacillaceae TaxID=186817 RepID=UPI001407B219|nr:MULTISPECIES: bh protein [Bacillaceae]MBO0958654.1 bh protein [Neobacillus sp. MM2021_6]NHC20206.1 bh protein [Bacillus sp. MM2020_4]
MKISEIDVSLYCSHCHDDTLHHVQYLNNKIQSIKCTNCHRRIETEMNPMRELYKEVYKRVTSKPTRLTDEYKTDHGKFIEEFPKRVLSKPLRLVKYLNETKGALNKIKKRVK